MRPIQKRLRTVYLYPDGHAVAMWEKRDRDAGTIEWAEIHERWGPAVGIQTGRLILNGQLALLVRGARAVNARPASIDAGSESTRAAGLALDTLEVLPQGAGIDWPVHFHNVPSMLSGPWTFQPDAGAETFDDVREKATWGLSNVGRVHYRRRKKSPAGA